MLKILTLLSLSLVLLFSSCKKDDETNEYYSSANQDLSVDVANSTVDDHTRSGDSRSTSQGSNFESSGVTWTTEGSTRGNQVRSILTIDNPASTQRQKKTGEKVELEVVWFAESDDETNEYDGLAYWCYNDGTYDVENWQNGEQWWGYWYISEDGSQLAFDINSEFEQIFDITKINNSSFSLFNSTNDVTWTYKAFDLNTSGFVPEYTTAELENFITKTFWRESSIKNADEDVTYTYSSDDVSLVKYTEAGKVDTYSSAIGQWVYADYDWEYLADQHAIRYTFSDNNTATYYFSYLGDYDTQIYRWDGASQSVETWSLEDVEYWYNINVATEFSYSAQ